MTSYELNQTGKLAGIRPKLASLKINLVPPIPRTAGKGAFGQVHLGSTTDGQHYAIKVSNALWYQLLDRLHS